MESAHQTREAMLLYATPARATRTNAATSSTVKRAPDTTLLAIVHRSSSGTRPLHANQSQPLQRPPETALGILIGDRRVALLADGRDLRVVHANDGMIERPSLCAAHHAPCEDVDPPSLLGSTTALPPDLGEDAEVVLAEQVPYIFRRVSAIFELPDHLRYVGEAVEVPQGALR